MIVEEMEVNYGLHAVVSFMSTLVGCSINRVGLWLDGESRVVEIFSNHSNVT